MPLIGLRPTKARLVMEDNRDSVLVLKVVLDDDEAIELSTGGALKDLAGVLRIRERRAAGNGSIGSVVYVASGSDPRQAPAKFQVNVAMAADKFATLLRVANAGRMPSKFILHAGARGGADAKALAYRMRSGERIKAWDNHAFRTLPVTNYVMILPMEVAPLVTGAMIADPASPMAPATNAQVAELMDDMLMFQSDTRTTMFGFACVLAIVALAALAIGVSLFYR